MTTPAFGSDRAEPLPDGSIALTCAISKGWSSRRAGAQTSAEHPGTAVRWNDGIFEVLEATALPGGGTRYRLGPWQDRHAIRHIEAYDAPSEAARAAEQSRRASSIWRRRLALLLAPLLGHLPGAMQKQMELDFGAPAVALTILSALPLLVIGVLGSLSHIAGAFGAPPVFPWAPPLPVSVYLIFESAVRIGSAWLQDQPMGSVAGALLVRIARALRGGAKSGPAPLPATAARQPEAAGQDRFRVLEPLLSLLRRDEQELLERRYGFELLRWGRVSAAVLFLVGAANVAASLAALAGGVAGSTDVVWLTAGLALCVEQALRWKEIARGRPRGSVLGALVRPFARSLLAAPGG
ncbi:MAG TPA: hypothetical protein VOA00_10980 [Thermoanaerobaculia bacterium]|nr:hypothetical protein [Thermoanaerobaculia bacterium]